jgi:hypothetical protein
MAVMFNRTFVPPDVTDDAVEIAAMAREIPLKDLHSIITPSGYHQLAPNNRPAIWYEKRVGAHTFNGVYPYAVPSLGLQDKTVFVAQARSVHSGAGD